MCFFILFLLSFFIFFTLLFLFWHYFIRQTFLFPNSFKQLLQKFSLNWRNFIFNFGKILKFLWLFIGAFNIFLDYCFNLLIAQLHSNSTLFCNFLEISSTFKFFCFNILYSKVKMSLMSNITFSNPFWERFSEALTSMRQFRSNWIKKITNFLFSFLKTTKLDRIKKVFLSCRLWFKKVLEKSLSDSKVFGNSFNLGFCVLHDTKIK